MEKQTDLYERYIAPHESHFLATLIWLRRKVDAIFHEKQRLAWFEDPNSLPEKGFRHIQNYPHWHCLEIRDRVFHLLQNITDIQYLENFRKQGGKIEKRWLWVNNDRVRILNNVMMIWNMVIDVASEEVWKMDIPVHRERIWWQYTPLNLIKYKELAEEYQHLHIYSALPLLGDFSVFFPFISIDSLWRIDFKPNGYGVKTHLETRWIEAYLILCENMFQRTLTVEEITGIQEGVQKLKDKAYRKSIRFELNELLWMNCLLPADDEEARLEEECIDSILCILEQSIVWGIRNNVSFWALNRFIRLWEKKFIQTMIYISHGLHFFTEWYNLEIVKRFLVSE